jgi:hypothetical protein
MNDAETISVVSAEQEPDPSFFPTPIGHVASRDLNMEGHLMFDHLIQCCIHNPMTHSEDAEHPSLRDILLDHLKSRNAWNEAFQVQMRIMKQNKLHLREIYSELHSRYIRALDTNEMNMYTSFDRARSGILEQTRSVVKDSVFLNEFYDNNRGVLVREHESDADEPFNLFRVKLPVWCVSGREGLNREWHSLEHVLRVFVRESVNPRVPDGDFCPMRYIRRIFSNRVISERTPTQRREYNDFRDVMNHIRSKVKVRNLNDTMGIFVRGVNRSQHTPMGKIRYTLGMILRWLELTHFCVFRDQVSHSILYSFYRNIHTIPVRMTPPIAVRNQNYIHAHVRTLTSENMPEESDDPVLYIPFEVGMNVYKMGCCRKDICSDSIIGILRSGRTPKCPMCRTDLLTSDSSFAPNPTLESILPPDDGIIEIIPRTGLYLHNPLIPVQD